MIEKPRWPATSVHRITKGETMVIVGKSMEKTNAGRWFVSNNNNTFNTKDVTRWGLYVAYGKRGYTLVCECYGAPIAVQVSGLPKSQQAEMKAVRKAMKVSGIALSSIRSARDAGIVWDESGVYVP